MPGDSCAIDSPAAETWTYFGDGLVVAVESLLFEDGFESGDTLGCSATVP